LLDAVHNVMRPAAPEHSANRQPPDNAEPVQPRRQARCTRVSPTAPRNRVDLHAAPVRGSRTGERRSRPRDRSRGSRVSQARGIRARIPSRAGETLARTRLEPGQDCRVHGRRRLRRLCLGWSRSLCRIRLSCHHVRGHGCGRQRRLVLVGSSTGGAFPNTPGQDRARSRSGSIFGRARNAGACSQCCNRVGRDSQTRPRRGAATP